jgi:phosphatidylinositol alpha-1,6-mannosyltransferase
VRVADFGEALERPGSSPAPLRVALVSHVLNAEDHSAARIGGAERAAAELLAALRRRKDLEVTPIVDAAASDPWRFLSFVGGAFRQVKRLARAGRIDAVLFTAMPTAWMAAALRPALRRARVVSAAVCHGHDVVMDFAPYQALVRATFRALDAVAPVSWATGRRCRERGLDAARMHVTPNGVDASRFGPAPRPDQRRALLEAAFPAETAVLPSDGLVLCSVGRLIRRKGHAWFVREVMPRLPADVHLWLAGDGPEAPAIDEAALAAGVSARVWRLGETSEADLAALYRGADLFLMPNIPVAGDIEGFGLVMLEANLNGLPVLASDFEGLAEVVTDGVNGRLAPVRDAAAFARIVLELKQDPQARHALGLRAELHARSGFSWDAVAARHASTLHLAREGVLATAGPGLSTAWPASASKSVIRICDPSPVLDATEAQMQHVIVVSPTRDGWVMRSGDGEPLLFESSAQAVWSARKVGEAVAEGGVPAEIVVLQRDGRQAGRFVCPPAAMELELT